MDRAQRRVSSLAGLSSRAWLTILLTALYAVAVVGMFYSTIATMIETWVSSETFTHGFLIAPISIWLVWRERQNLSTSLIRPQPKALILTVCGGVAWLIAHQVSVNVVQQLALVFIFVTGLWSIVGTAIVYRIGFPLAFLFLAVPMGEELIAPLMTFTADTLELMVRASGIPVYREGTNLSLPTGNWSVVEACSGVRYLIASVTLGLLYAHLTYARIGHKLVFVLASILLPILANSVRAYGIVMIGHLSGMELATGADHLLYGWVFFGLVMILLFWVGGFWREDKPVDASVDALTQVAGVASFRPAIAVLATLAAILVSGIGPAVAASLNGNVSHIAAGPLSAPTPVPGWKLIEDPGWNWQPKQLGADRELDAYYSDAGQPVAVLLRQYLQHSEGGELVPGRQTWRADRVDWKIAGEQTAGVNLVGEVKVDEAILVSSTTRLLVWAWYRIGHQDTANPYAAKMLEAKQKILNQHRDGTRIFVATPVGEDLDAARRVLQEFLTRHYAGMTQALDSPQAGGEPNG